MAIKVNDKQNNERILPEVDEVKNGINGKLKKFSSDSPMLVKKTDILPIVSENSNYIVYSDNKAYVKNYLAEEDVIYVPAEGYRYYYIVKKESITHVENVVKRYSYFLIWTKDPIPWNGISVNVWYGPAPTRRLDQYFVIPDKHFYFGTTTTLQECIDALKNPNTVYSLVESNEVFFQVASGSHSVTYTAMNNFIFRTNDDVTGNFYYLSSFEFEGSAQDCRITDAKYLNTNDIYDSVDGVLQDSLNNRYIELTTAEDAIMKPEEAPASTVIPSIDTNNDQINLRIGSGLEIVDGALKTTVGEETYKMEGTYSSGYFHFLRCKIKKQWETVSAKITFLDANKTNYNDRPCTVVLYAKSTDKQLDVYLDVESGMSEYPAQLYANYDPNFTNGQEATIDVYYLIRGQYSGAAYKVEASCVIDDGATPWQVISPATYVQSLPAVGDNFRLLSSSLHWAWYNQTYSGMTVGHATESYRSSLVTLSLGSDLNDMIPPTGKMINYRCDGAANSNTILHTPVSNLNQTFYMFAVTTWHGDGNFLRCIQVLYTTDRRVYVRGLDFTSGDTPVWKDWIKVLSESDISDNLDYRYWSNRNRPTAQEIGSNSNPFTNQTDTVVEYRRMTDGSSWYRVWESGWKECGGIITASGDTDFTFPFNFKFMNANYVVSFSYAGTTDQTTLSIKNMSAWNKTVSGFSCRAGASNLIRTWKAEGY